ncbi:hypothetical protein AU192_07080 [Mycobacterium lehmannii]|uniref:Gap protein n=1 Tax=Mycobacterium lehmannii TaxID=2048550 RepID=A0A117JJS8_9MYCO|nr:GAP family protein [Mycobacterium lehmannii]KUI15622.1 hypothetical protein AU192_07080 [Mycobacterium lehmannii]
MWGSLLGLALLISLNPVLLGFILLIISRPRPVQNLFFYWVGALTVNLPLFLVPLALLHMTPGFASFADGLGTPPEAVSGTLQPFPLIIATVLLAIAVVMAVRPRLRERASARAGGGDDSSAMHPHTVETNPAPRNRLVGRVNNVVAAIQRLYERLTSVWDRGSPWVAFVFGMMYLPSATLVLLIDTTIVASGAGIGEQVAAAIAFVLGFLAVLELVLLSYVFAPAKTEAVLRPLHEWARAHNRHILIVFFVLIAIWQLARGFSLA